MDKDPVEAFTEFVVSNAKVAGLVLPARFNPEEHDELNANNQFPSDITQIDIRELGRQHGFWVGQLGRALYALSEADSTLVYVDTEYDKFRSQAFFTADVREVDGKKKLVGSIEAEVAQNPNVMKWGKKRMVAQATQIMMKHLVRTYERYTDSLSREISRRGMEIDHQDKYGHGEVKRG